MNGDVYEGEQVQQEQRPMEQLAEGHEAPQLEAAPEVDAVYCPNCGAKMAPEDRYCGDCGWDAEIPDHMPKRVPLRTPRKLGPPSDKNRLTALLLCLLIGFLGVHRFYVGRAGSGVVWLLTLGLLGVGWIYDCVMIATGEFVDEDGKRLVYWE